MDYIVVIQNKILTDLCLCVGFIAHPTGLIRSNQRVRCIVLGNARKTLFPGKCNGKVAVVEDQMGR